MTEDKGECQNSLNSDDLAFLQGPLKDGIIRRTDGTLIVTLQDLAPPLIKTKTEMNEENQERMMKTGIPRRTLNPN